MAFECHRSLRLFGTFCNYVIQRRCYARGSRYFPPRDRHEEKTLNKENSSSENEISHDSNPAHENSNQPMFTSERGLFSRDKYLSKLDRETPEQLLKNAATFSDAGKGRRGVAKQMEDVWDSSPYPKNTNPKNSQDKFSVRPKRNPADTSIILFPGQGEQFN